MGEAVLMKKYIRKLRDASEYRVTTMPDKEAFPKSKHARPGPIWRCRQTFL